MALTGISSVAGQLPHQAVKLGLLRSGHAELVVAGLRWHPVQAGELEPDVKGYAAPLAVAVVHVRRVQQEGREQEHRASRGREPGIRSIPRSCEGYAYEWGGEGNRTRNALVR